LQPLIDGRVVIEQWPVFSALPLWKTFEVAHPLGDQLDRRSEDLKNQEFRIAGAVLKLDELLVSLTGKPELRIAVMGIRFDPERIGLYYAMCLQGAGDDPKFKAWIKDGLVAVSTERWRQSIESWGLLIELLHYPGPIDVPKYEAALVQTGTDLMSGALEPGAVRLNGKSFIDPLTAEAKVRVRSAFLDAVEQADEIAPGFFEVFGDEIATDGFLPAPERYKYSFSKLLEERNARGLQWVSSVLASPDFQRASEPMLEFRDRILEAIVHDPKDSASDPIRDIGRRLGILEGASSLPERPTVGMTVGFVHDPNTIYEAQVVEVMPDDPMAVTLGVETPRGRELYRRVRYDQNGKTPGTYHFKPERATPGE
jgi:hypothetical protein